LDKPNIVYIIGTYPLLTTTFIDREIRSLRDWKIKVRVVAIRRPTAGMPLSQGQKELQAGVTYLLPVSWSELVRGHLFFAVFYLPRYLRTLAYLITRRHPTHRARMKTILHFGQGVYMAYRIRHEKFQELHAHFADRAATVALVAGKLLDKPYSLSIHAAADIFVAPVLLPEKVEQARHIVTCTLHNKRHLESIVGQDLGKKISCIHHGLDLSLYQPSTARAVAARPLILSVGQLTERKGFRQLIHACRRLRDQGYDFHCHIVGDGPLRPALEKLIVQQSLADCVLLCGAMPHEAVIEKYRQASLFVLPCIQSPNGDVDGIPNVLAEAMAMQLPVVSTSISAIPEIVQDQVNGLLVPPDDVEALASAVTRLFQQPAFAEEIGKNARHTITGAFDVERNVKQFAAALWPGGLD
jgi:glycosyltransferase involved in cell wall biosynthesis